MAAYLAALPAAYAEAAAAVRAGSVDSLDGLNARVAAGTLPAARALRAALGPAISPAGAILDAARVADALEGK